jgi:hypothetical protein
MTSRPVHCALTLALLVALAFPGTGGLAPGADAASATGAACDTFPETGMVVCDRFLDYWRANGRLAQQGLPLSPLFTEISPTDGKSYLVQYFERARFELHPENAPPFDVLLGLLGSEQVAKYGNLLPPGVSGNPLGTSCVEFSQTGEQICGAFLAYWDEHGGLAQYGLPLTGLILETNPTDGKQYPTQYFERARFEYHVQNAGTSYAVQLGLLGREQFAARYPNGLPGDPAEPSLPPAPLPSPIVSPKPSPPLS